MGIALIPACFLVVLAALVGVIYHFTGELTYGLDDTYIHLTLAHNLWAHGTWGIAPGVFAPASSSLLWTLLLAFFASSPALLNWTPLLLNAIAACAILATFTSESKELSTNRRLFVLLLAILCTPLLLLCLGGMEHLLHAWLCCAFLLAFQSALSGRSNWNIYLVAILLGATRYESIFLVAPACFFLWRARRGAVSALLLFTALLPAIVFALASKAKGWFILPSTLVLKKNISLARLIQDGDLSGVMPGLAEILRTFFAQAVVACSLTFSLATLFAIWIHCRRPQIAGSKGERILSYSAATVFIGGVMHLLFASVAGQAYRYEAYLLVLFMLILAQTHTQLTTAPTFLKRRAYWFTLLIFFLPRVIGAHAALIISATNINEQQGLLARFIDQHYPNDRVGVNDIGVVSYKTAAQVIDLFGLAQHEIALAKYNGSYTSDTLATVAADAQFAAVFDSWFDGGRLLPTSWVKVAEWEHSCNFVCTDPIISFYAIKERPQQLQGNLAGFEAQLPAAVRAWYPSH